LWTTIETLSTRKIVMDIICAKCGRHLNSIEAARDHVGHCIEGEVAFYIPLSRKLSQSDTNRNDNESHSHSESILSEKYEGKCPLTKTEGFPCPRCCYCQSETERGDFFKVITWWYCKYPKIVNWRMVTVEDILRIPPSEDK
jgi:hypothetical protein